MLRANVEKSVDLVWIEKMILNQKFNSNFVNKFTRYEAKPNWNALKKHILGKSMKKSERSSLMMKLKGFLGEEAAERMIKKKLKQGLGKYEKVRRGYHYGKGSIDFYTEKLVGNKIQFDFFEVKNWAPEIWLFEDKMRKGLLAQLRRHNKGIDKFLTKTVGGTQGKKILYLEEKGYLKGLMRLPNKTKNSMLMEIEKLGWKIEVMPTKNVESVTSYIERLK